MAAICEAKALDYSGRPAADPLGFLGVESLVGEGRYATTPAQVQLPMEALNDSKNLAYQAFMKVPDVGKPQRSFTNIRQGLQEPYMKFIETLKDALDKQVENEEARQILLQKLAIENANTDCQKVLRPLKNPTVVQMIEECNRVGTTEHQAVAMAAAFANIKLSQQTCFTCGRPGHFKRQCLQAGRWRREPADSQLGTCPKCRKGWHFANQCLSRYDKDGQPIQGNGRRSAGRGRAMTQAAPHVMMQAAPSPPLASVPPNYPPGHGEVPVWTWPPPSQ